MGLDMYLYKKTYVKQWDHHKEKERFNINIQYPTEGERKDTRILPARITHITEEVAYWRKANQIHNWFIQNYAQNQEDDCQPIEMPKEAITKLHDLCVELLKNRDPEEAKQKLPTISGFFFGDTDYNADYWIDLEHTVKQLAEEIKTPGSFWSNYEYQASW